MLQLKYNFNCIRKRNQPACKFLRRRTHHTGSLRVFYCHFHNHMIAKTCYDKNVYILAQEKNQAICLKGAIHSFAQQALEKYLNIWGQAQKPVYKYFLLHIQPLTVTFFFSVLVNKEKIDFNVSQLTCVLWDGFKMRNY